MPTDTLTEVANATEVAESPRETVVMDGYLCDAETGEVLGLVEMPKETFAVVDEDSLDWVLGKILDAESDLIAIERSAEVIRARAVLANVEKMRKEKQSRLDWLHARFDGEIREFTAKALEGKKGRTLKRSLGSISLKTVKGGIRLADEQTAIELARLKFPEAVRVVPATEKFMISQLNPGDRAYIESQLSTAEPGPYARAFELKPDTLTVTIKTGVSA